MATREPGGLSLGRLIHATSARVTFRGVKQERAREEPHVFKPNLGKTERAARLVLGVLIAGWVFRRPSAGMPEALASVAALFLVLNALLSRCYLWRALGISTCPAGTPDQD